MQFTRLWPLGLLIIVPLLILMYMLRKKNQPKVVSSTFLWREIYETTYADKPWQKLRNHILLVLQILAVLLVVLALMAPKVPWGAHYYKNVIFVVDDSASMNAVYEEDTRLEAAKTWMKDYIHKAGEETKGYLITTGGAACLTLAGSSDTKVLLSAIDHIEPHYNVAKLDEGIQMGKALGESLGEAYEIVVLTDTQQDTVLQAGRYVYFGNTGMNGAITLMAHQLTKDGMTVLMQVTNKGSKRYEGDASLYGEEKLLDVEEVSLEPGESVTLHFSLINAETKVSEYDYFKGEISTKDNIEEDNTYYYVQNEAQGRKVLLVTESNVFLEKALMTLPDCEVYKTNDLSMVDSKEHYDLYVLDGQKVSSWPDGGNILLIDCDTSGLIEGTPLTTAKKVESSGAILPDYLKGLSFVASGCTSYKLPYWAKSILHTDDETVGFIGEKNGQKVGILGFDLWNSDFVLKTEFPLLMYYLGDELLDTARVSKSNFTSDEMVTLRQNNLDELFNVQTLSGKKINLNGNSFSTDIDLGIYQVDVHIGAKSESSIESTTDNAQGMTNSVENKNSETKINEASRESFFLAVNYPTTLESDLSNEVLGEVQMADEAGSLKGEMNLTPYLMGLLLSVVLAEWYFYRKGY